MNASAKSINILIREREVSVPDIARSKTIFTALLHDQESDILQGNMAWLLSLPALYTGIGGLGQ